MYTSGVLVHFNKIVSFIDLVPTSGAGVDSSSEESPVASPALLPKLRATSKTLSCEYACGICIMSGI